MMLVAAAILLAAAISRLGGGSVVVRAVRITSTSDVNRLAQNVVATLRRSLYSRFSTAGLFLGLETGPEKIWVPQNPRAPSCLNSRLLGYVNI